MDKRKEQILNAIVFDFVLSAEPVSSKKLQEHYQMKYSTATIRNEMAMLEEMGLLYQPHTSAGRIPTDIGYRYYVDSLPESSLKCNEEQKIASVVAKMSRVIEDSLHETSVLLSQLTRYAAIVFAPLSIKTALKRLDLVSLGAGRVLAVIIMNTGSVEKSLIELNGIPQDSELECIEDDLNKILAGCTIADFGHRKNELNKIYPDYQELLMLIADRLAECFRKESEGRVFLEGAVNILEQPEFENLRRFRDVFEVLERRYLLIQFFKEAINSERTVVKIGAENKSELIDDCSLIGSAVRVEGDTLGILGVIGPTRMDYARNISTVEFIAEELARMLSGSGE